jgi:hypothetical protein
VERTNFYTHVEGRQEQAASGDRKRFVGVLAQAVIQRLLDAQTSTWVRLGSAVAGGFKAREALAWSTDPRIETTLHDRGWDGVMPAQGGDFLNDAEFEYGAKNGAGLKRTFDHVVTIATDGSARMATDLTIANTEPPDPGTNIDSLSYITLYGPRGSKLADGTDPPYAIEQTLIGHPAAGWLSSAAPGDETTLRVVWQGPGIVVRQPNGTLIYQVHWMHLAGHVGDVLHLQVDLPPGWHWIGPAPPATVGLNQDFSGSWTLKAASTH